MESREKFFAEVQLNGYSLADIKPGYALRDRYLLKDFLEYVHLKKGLLEAYDAAIPLGGAPGTPAVLREELCRISPPPQLQHGGLQPASHLP